MAWVAQWGLPEVPMQGCPRQLAPSNPKMHTQRHRRARLHIRHHRRALAFACSRLRNGIAGMDCRAMQGTLPPVRFYRQSTPAIHLHIRCRRRQSSCVGCAALSTTPICIYPIRMMSTSSCAPLRSMFPLKFTIPCTTHTPIEMRHNTGVVNIHTSTSTHMCTATARIGFLIMA